MVSGNPQGVGGQALDADSATEAQILQQNSDVTLRDMSDLVYRFAADEGRNRAFYMHTDPLIELPLARRQAVHTPEGVMMEKVQVFLTPEARRGDFLDWTFSVQPESMQRMDSRTRLQRSMEFAIKVLPAVMQAALVAMQLGIPFNVAKAVEKMAKEAGVTWMDEVWYDPEFQRKWQAFQMMGPQEQGSKGSSAQPNGQPRTVMKVRGPTQQIRRDQQMGAAQSQSQLPTNQVY